MKISNHSIIFLLIVLYGCGGKFATKDTTATTSSAVLSAGESEPGARIIFSKDNFTDLNDFADPVNAATTLSTTHSCLGDVLKVYYVDGDDYMGSPTALPTPSLFDGLTATNRPAFVKNVSVDITSTYYPTTQSSTVSSDSCTYRAISSAPISSSCADFDRTPAAIPAPTIAPTATPIPTPVPSITPTTNEYFGSNYYRVRDDWCTSQGPTVSADPEVTKAGVGGVSIDLDRTQLGSSEDLLMVITYHALNANSKATSWPATRAINKSTGALLAAGSRTAQGTNDHTILKVNLIGTQQSLESLLLVAQPRPWTYNNTSSFPIYMKEISTLEDPFGSLRTEQIYIPLSQNALVDRIRIERIRGSFHLYQIDLYRLGNRAE